jgi:hypothetical protein
MARTIDLDENEEAFRKLVEVTAPNVFDERLVGNHPSLMWNSAASMSFS